MRDDCGLAGSVGGIPRCPTQIPGRSHCVAAGGARLHHLDLAAHPGAGMLDRLTRPRVLRSNRLETVKDMLSALCCPQREEVMV